MNAEPSVNAALPEPAKRSLPSRSLDEQRHDRHHAGDRRLAGHLREPQRRDRAPLHGRAIDRGLGEAHDLV